MEPIYDAIYKALGYLFISFIIYSAWNMAQLNAAGGKYLTVLWKGFLICAGIALFTSFTLGNPTCEQSSDPVYGGCEEYADDGYEPTTEQRVANFAYYMTLLYVPVVIGALKKK